LMEPGGFEPDLTQNFFEEKCTRAKGAAKTLACLQKFPCLRNSNR
jgi:hypothetical protein